MAGRLRGRSNADTDAVAAHCDIHTGDAYAEATDGYAYSRSAYGDACAADAYAKPTGYGYCDTGCNAHSYSHAGAREGSTYPYGKPEGTKYRWRSCQHHLRRGVGQDRRSGQERGQTDMLLL